MEELKPCPFCGGGVKVHKSEFFEVDLLFFTCPACGAKVSFDEPVCNIGAVYGDYFPTKNAWNKRHERTCRIVPHGHLFTLSDGTELYESACSECGAYLGDEDNYCSICGAKVVS